MCRKGSARLLTFALVALVIIVAFFHRNLSWDELNKNNPNRAKAVTLIHEIGGALYVSTIEPETKNINSRLLIQPSKDEYFWGPKFENGILAVNVERLSSLEVNYVKLFRVNTKNWEIKELVTLGDTNSMTKLIDIVRGKVYYISTQESDYSAVYEYDLFSNEKRKISENEKDVVYASVSASGERLAFMEWLGPDYSWKTVLVNLRTGESKTLKVPTNWTYPVISSRGEFIAFLEEDETSRKARVAIYNVKSARLVRVLENFQDDVIYCSFSEKISGEEVVVITSREHGIIIADPENGKILKTMKLKSLPPYTSLRYPILHGENLLFLTADSANREPDEESLRTKILLLNIETQEILKELLGDTFVLLNTGN